MAALAPIALSLALLAAQDVPRNDGWVTDLAGVLTAEQERALEALMESYQEGSGHDVAVLIVPELGGRALETFALEVARAWKLGSADKNEGALLLVAIADRKMRIEVGRGLEGNVPDVVAGRIIRDVITPHFKRGDYHQGVREGVLALHAAAGGDYGPIESSRGGGDGAIAVVGLLPLIFLFLLIGALGRGGRGGGGWFWPLVILSGMRGSRGHWNDWNRPSGLGGGLGGGGGFGGGFGGFGGGGGFSGGGASGGW